MPWPYVYAPLPSESITFMPFMHLPLPPHLSDSVVRSGSCLTLAMWKIHGSLGLCSLHSLHRALLGCRPSSSYLAHVPFFPIFVGLADDPAMPLHCSCYDITSLLFRCYPWAHGLRLLPIHFLHSFFFWASLANIPAGPAHFPHPYLF